MGVSHNVMTNVWPVEGWEKEIPGRLDVYREVSFHPYRREHVGHAVRVCQDGPSDAFALMVLGVEDGVTGADFKVLWASPGLRKFYKPCIVATFRRGA